MAYMLNATYPGPRRGSKPVRLDKWLAGQLADAGYSRGRVRVLIESGAVKVDGVVVTVARHALTAGVRVTVDTPQKADDTAHTITPSNGPLEVVYADEHLAVIDKPAGLTTHPAPSVQGETVVHRLLHHFPQVAQVAAQAGLDPQRPGIVHRLDRDTSGLMVVALSMAAQTRLAKAFAGREVHKVYLALVRGHTDLDETEVQAPIGRDPQSRVRMAVDGGAARPAKSTVRTLWRSPEGSTPVSLVAVRIFTGRTHQVRVHMAHLGHPLVGDGTYADHATAKRSPRMLLHAARLGVDHPVTGTPLAFASTPPEIFFEVAAQCVKRPVRLGIVGMPGSGKSALLRLLAERDVPTFSADAEVARLYEHGADGWQELHRRWGERFAPYDGPVDKRALFAAMQDDPRVRREVESFVHPLVRHALGGFYTEHAQASVVAAEIPLLFEAGFADDVDVVAGVQAGEARLQRLQARGMDADTAAALDGWQWPEAKKLASCDHVVDNTGDEAALAREADRLLEQLQTSRQDDARTLRNDLHALCTGPLI